MNEIIEKNIDVILQNTNPRYENKVKEALMSLVTELSFEHIKTNDEIMVEMLMRIEPEYREMISEIVSGLKIMKEHPRLLGLALFIKGKNFWKSILK